MKPKNFPERVRQRRLRALDRLKSVAGPGEATQQTLEMLALQQRVANGIRRHVTTKKDRSGRAAFSRQAG